MRNRGESGQAILLVVVSLGLVLIGALGLAIDTAQLYGQQRLAQTAADAAAQAGIMTLFDHTGTVTAHTCSAADAETPCVYARYNGFNLAGDTITIATNVPAPGVALSTDPSDPITTLQATVTRPVQTGLMRLVGAANTMTIQARAVAAIISQNVPIPIIVTHPSLGASGSVPAAFHMKGGGSTIGLTICGGPSRSIEVNSSSTTSVSADNHATVDLSKAGPLDSGACDNGTGADFGDFGGARRFSERPLVGNETWGLHPAFLSDPILCFYTVPYPPKPSLVGVVVPGTVVNFYGTGHGCLEPQITRVIFIIQDCMLGAGSFKVNKPCLRPECTGSMTTRPGTPRGSKPLRAPP